MPPRPSKKAIAKATSKSKSAASSGSKAKPAAVAADKLDKNLKAATLDKSTGYDWLSATDTRLQLRGLPWFAANGGASFSRLPLGAEGRVRDPVWQLAQCPAGGHLAFRTDSPRLALRLRTPNTACMPHMPMSGSNGAILYCGEPGMQRPWATAIPDYQNAEFERPLVADLPPGMREYRLYLPLYKHLLGMELGVAPGASFETATAPRLAKPVVVYGTSITQGGCASTAGTDYPSILGRLLNLEMINLGFSGNGRGEPELAEYISEIDASLYVIDYAANVDEARLRYTLPRFVKILRAKRPEVPILLVTNIFYGRADHNATIRRIVEDKRDIMMAYYCRQRAQGDYLMHLADGFALVNHGADAVTVDGVHPTDHGFMAMAHGLAPALTRILFPGV